MLKNTVIITFLLISACCRQEKSLKDNVSFVNIAIKARESGNSEMAIKFYDKALQKNPHDLDALIGKAEAYIDTNRLYHANKILNELAVKYPQNEMIHHLLGKIAFLNFDYPQAISQFSQSSLFKSRNALGVIYNTQKQYDRAHGIFFDVIKMDPTHPEAYNNLGMSYLELKRYNEAIYYLEKACNLKGANVIHRSNLALAYGLVEEYDKALELYKTDCTVNIAKIKVQSLKNLVDKKLPLKDIDTKIAMKSLNLKKAQISKKKVVKQSYKHVC